MSSSSKSVSYPGDALKTGTKELLKTGLFSDFKIIDSSGNTWNVHKAILYPQSKFFEKALTGGFMEAKKDSITLTEDEGVVQALVNWFYCFTWDDGKKQTLHTKTEFAVLVYQAADKYDVPGLQQLAAKRFAAVCDPINDVTSFICGIDAVEECCNPNDRTLWDIVMTLIKNNMAHLLKFEVFKTLIKDNDELNFGLLGEIYGGLSVSKIEGREEPESPRSPGYGGRRLDETGYYWRSRFG